MSSIHAARHLVLARLGAPKPLLPGERIVHRSPQLERIYRRYEQYIDEGVIAGRLAEAIESFVRFLEAERERDFDAFDYGRELLLANLEVHVEHPPAPSEHGPGSRPAPVARRSRKRLRLFRHSSPASKHAAMRQRVLDALGCPEPRLPGECYLLDGGPALHEAMSLCDRLEEQPLTPRVLDEVISCIARLRRRDWQAFCLGRSTLLELLPCAVELAPAC